jgi:dephospho-CoA kinase
VLKIGITGGIGSGKTVVCKIFTALGISIYHADERAKFLIGNKPAIQKEIIKIFGRESFTLAGYNTTYIAKMVFNDPDLLRKLNVIIHPHIADDFYTWCGVQNNATYVIQESAILLNRDLSDKIDHIIVVQSPEALRMDRLRIRNGFSEQEIKKRMNSQPTSEKYNSMADWIILNDEYHPILPQVLSVHKQILNLVSSNG